jgi:DNA-binding LytR/AlgR family response regulator
LAHEADLAFVDVRLADGLSGPRIAQKLNKGFGVAVVYLTGNPKLIAESDEPVFELVTKPHTSESIVEALRATAAASIQTATAASHRNELEAPGNDVKTPPDV